MATKRTDAARSTPAASRPGTPPRPEPAQAFWRTKSAAELAAEQGVRPIARLEEVLGKAAGLWADDADLDAFLAELHRRRQQGG
jgi:uncharacterized protein (DUF2384 family)